MDVKKYFFIIVFLLIPTIHLIAQDTVRVLNLSFEQCIEIALENNLQLKQSELNLKNQKINVLQSKLNQLPSFYLSGNYGNNWGRSIDPTTNQFTTSESYNSGIAGFSQFQIFNGFQIRNSIKKSRNDLEKSSYDLEKARNDGLEAMNSTVGEDEAEKLANFREAYNKTNNTAKINAAIIDMM